VVNLLELNQFGLVLGSTAVIADYYFPKATIDGFE
jgi:hypothetical protein